MIFLGIDPGMKGAFVFLDESSRLEWKPMPLKEGRVDYDGVLQILVPYRGKGIHVGLERAHASAMGVTGAFNYGRDFAAIEIAIRTAILPVTYIEPSKWTKVIHDGIPADLKAKAKSRIAVERLFPQMISQIPQTKTKKLHEGVVDALLIAEYGRRKILGGIL